MGCSDCSKRKGFFTQLAGYRQLSPMQEFLLLRTAIYARRQANIGLDSMGADPYVFGALYDSGAREYATYMRFADVVKMKSKRLPELAMEAAYEAMATKADEIKAQADP